MKTQVRRGITNIIFEGNDGAWSATDPTREGIINACDKARYSPASLTPTDALLLAEAAGSYAALLTHPAGESMIRKFRALRAAVKRIKDGTL